MHVMQRRALEGLFVGGLILMERQVIERQIKLLDEEGVSFRGATARAMVDAIRAILATEEVVDFVSVGETMKKQGTFDSAGGAEAMVNLARAFTGDAHRVEQMASQLAR